MAHPMGHTTLQPLPKWEFDEGEWNFSGHGAHITLKNVYQSDVSAMQIFNIFGLRITNAEIFWAVEKISIAKIFEDVAHIIPPYQG